MYYYLADGLRLRGWQHLTSVLVDRLERKVGIVPDKRFSLLMLCDGESELEEVLQEPEKREILETLLEDKIVVASKEKHPIKKIQRYKYYDNRYFSSIFWSITGKCNFQCRHCYMDAPHGQLGELSHEEMIDIIDQIAECGIHSFDFTGGEPFVRKDFWEIVDYMLTKRMYVNKIYTNGWLLNETTIAEFAKRKMHPAISISFDGVGWHDWMRGVKGAEERTVRALKVALDAGLPVDVEVSLHKGSIHTMRETINFLASIGVRAIKIGLVVNTPLWNQKSEGNAITPKEYYDACLEYIPHFFEDGMPATVQLGGGINLYYHSKEFKVLAEKAQSEEQCTEQYLCGAARFSAYITPEGRFLPCMALTAVEEQKNFPLVREIGVKKCMSDSYYINFVGKHVSDLLEKNKKCASCQYHVRCCGGCRAVAMMANNGDLFAHDPDACFLFENGYVDRFREVAEQAIAKYCS